MLEAGESDEREQLRGVLAMARLDVLFDDLDGKQDVLNDGPPFEQDRSLECDPNVGFRSRSNVACMPERSSCILVG
jgi:hypothetical protein